MAVVEVTDKLVNLEALQDLATRIKTELEKKADTTTVTQLSTQVSQLQEAGGEPNKIDKITINGNDVTMTSKTAAIKIKVNGTDVSMTEASADVDIKVPTTVAELTDHEDYALDTEVTEAVSALKTEITTRIASVYRPGGTIASDQLDETLLTKDNLGKVYNLSNSFNTSENFVDNDGEVKAYPAGTNVVVISTGAEEYKFDVLAGFIDLSPYAKTAEVASTYLTQATAQSTYETKEDLTSKLAEYPKTAELQDKVNELVGDADGENSGLMSAQDKNKLNGIQAEATKVEQGENGKIKINGTDTVVYTHPSYTTQVSGLYKITVDAQGHVSAAEKAAKADLDAVITNATAEAAGLMSDTDKDKLDKMETATTEDVQGVLDILFPPED